MKVRKLKSKYFAALSLTAFVLIAAFMFIACPSSPELPPDGTPGLAFELISGGANDGTYRVRSGTVSSGAVIIPDTYNGIAVTEIGSLSDEWGEGAFNDKIITSVTITNSITSIGNAAFNLCRNLTSITIPEGVTTIGTWAFTNCSGIETISISASVTSIGDNAFSACRNLESITVAVDNQNFSSENGILYNKAKTQLIRAPEKTSGNFVIPEGVTSISNSAFSACINLESITVPESVTSIGSVAFDRCANLTNITVAANNPNFTGEGGILYNKAKTQLIAFPSASGDFTIPAGVTSIGNGAFRYCGNLTSITITAIVTSIGSLAFEGCTNINNITIPASVTSMLGSVFFGWTASQTVNIQGHANQASADAAWGVGWRNNTNATIVYQP